MKRRIIFWLLIFIFIGLIITRFAEVSKLAQTLSSGNWGWVAGAAALQLAFYIVYAGIYEVAFATVQVHATIRELLPVLFSAVFVNVAVPTGGASGVALFIDDAARHHQSPARAAAGVLLVLTVDFTAFTVLLGLGLAHLALSGVLRTYDLIAAVILLGIIMGLAIALLLGLWRSSLLLHMLLWVQRLVNRIMGWFKRGPVIHEDWAAKHAMDFSAASIAIACNPWKLTRALIVALIAHGINLASIYLLFLAFYGPISPGTLIAGYAIGNLFWIVSITPQGVGVVEGVMTLAYTSLGIPVAQAAVVVLSYRGLAFWLPLIVGSITLRKIRAFAGGAPPPPSDEMGGKYHP